MYLELTNTLKEKILEYDELIKSASKKVNALKEVYEILKPKGKEFQKINVLNLYNNEALIDKIFSQINTNVIALESLMRAKIMYDEFDKEIDSLLKAANLTKEMIYNDYFLESLKRRGLISVYYKLYKMKQREEKIFRINEKLVIYICELVIDIYEGNKDKKESLKDEKKKIEYALKKIKRNENLLPIDIVCLNDVINEIEDDNKKTKLFSLLNNYLKEHTKKVFKEELSEKNVPKEENIVYVDNDQVIEEIKNEQDPVISNYLVSLKSLNDFDSVNMFLNAIKSKNDITITIHEIINLLTDSKEDELLKNYLLTYLNNEHKKEENNEIKDNLEKENIILYDGFLRKKNIILDDITKSDIPKEYYVDIKKGFDIIRQDGALNKRENVNRIKKVFKLRVNDIRIAFKRLSSNVYIILGVYVKKQNKGYNIIKSIKRRNEELLLNENSIIKAIEIDELWNEYLNVNDKLEKEIDSVINTKLKKI